jgi:putative transposase
MEKNQKRFFDTVSADNRRHGTKDFRVDEEKRRERNWQRRFWEHTIRDEKDFQLHCDYIHYNPVKNGYVQSPSEWQNSSFQRFVKAGLYNLAWGSMQIPELPDEIGGE